MPRIVKGVVTFLNLQVGKGEFLGRAIGKPHVNLCEDNYKTPILEWFQIFRGPEEAGKFGWPSRRKQSKLTIWHGSKNFDLNIAKNRIE